MSLCQYRNLLGEPQKGIHEQRVDICGFSLAAVDLGLTALAALLITYWLAGFSIIGFIFVFTGLWAMGIALHIAFCVQTPITYFLLKHAYKNKLT